MARIRANVVSAALRRGGLNPLGSGTSRMREGIRVTGGPVDSVHVAVDLDHDRKATRLAADCADVLREAGYAIDWRSGQTFYVSKAAG